VAPCPIHATIGPHISSTFTVSVATSAVECCVDGTWVAPNGALDRAAMADGLHDVSSSSLALGADHTGALGHAAQRLAEVSAAANKGNLKGVLVDVVHLVRGR
jgi:hypothetical protein